MFRYLKITLASYLDRRRVLFARTHSRKRAVGGGAIQKRSLCHIQAHKSPFVGKPSKSSVFKSFIYGSSPKSFVQVSYVSWNGATEVAKWEFYSTSATMVASEDDTAERTDLIGTAVRTGFETNLHSSGYADAVYAVALDVHGEVLGHSEVAWTVKPNYWLAEATREEGSWIGQIPLISDHEEADTLSFTRTEL